MDANYNPNSMIKKPPYVFVIVSIIGFAIFAFSNHDNISKGSSLKDLQYVSQKILAKDIFQLYIDSISDELLKRDKLQLKIKSLEEVNDDIKAAVEKLSKEKDALKGLAKKTVIESRGNISGLPKDSVDYYLKIYNDKKTTFSKELDSLSNPLITELNQIIDEGSAKEINDLTKQKDSIQNIIDKYKTKLAGIVKTYEGSKAIKFKGMEFDIFITNTDSNEISMHLKSPGKGKNYSNIIGLLNSEVLKGRKVLMITNAGMYTSSHEPEGLFIENRRPINELDKKIIPNTDLNFYMKPNGVYFIDTAEVNYISKTEDFEGYVKKNKINVKYATQSGPMLVIGGEIHDKFKVGSPNLNIRSGVGIISDKKTVFIISKTETNFYDFGVLFKEVFNCKNALYLDGAISLMYINDIAPNERGGNFGPMISVVKKEKNK